MKRYLAILLSLLLLMTTTPVVGANDIFNDTTLGWGENPPAIPDGPYVLASWSAGRIGGEVTVEVRLMNNPGLVSAKIKVGYDANVLELTDKAIGEFPASGYSWGQNTTNPFVINFCDAIAKSDHTFELFATLTFKIKDGAVSGKTYPLTLDFSCDDDFYDLNWNTIWFEKVEGLVYVLYPVTGVELDTNALNLYTGDSAQLTATVKSEGKADESVIWTSDNPAVATVDENGLVTAVGTGSANITVTTVDGGYTATCAVTVTCPHTNTTEVKAVASTCVVPGHETYTLCNDCGQVLAGSNADLPLADHTYQGAVTTEATCVADGVMTYTCSVCGDSYTEAIPATGKHTYESAVTTEATCGAAGVLTYTCSVCGDSYTEAIPATGKHTFDNACDAACNGCGFTRQVPDHVYDGVRDADCNECGDVREVSMAGDTNGDKKVNNRDLGVLQRYLNDIAIDIDLSAADVDQNNAVNNRDLGQLQRYLNGWNVELK